mgnify:CR=1 FL=1
MENLDLPAPPEKAYCVNHPQRETLLRCNRCEQPICIQCAVLTPTGYRCKSCVRSQQKSFETAQWLDYPMAVIISGLIAFGGSIVASLPIIGFLALFIGPLTGMLISEAVRRVVGKRRSKLLFQLAAGAAAAGCLPMLLPSLLALLMGGFSLAILWQGLYTFLVASTVYYRLSGIRVR